MKRGRSTGKPTKAEAARFEKIKEVGCIACRHIFGPGSACGMIEAHHLLSGGVRRGHAFSIPLGSFHHRGIPMQGYTTSQMRRLMGPSLRLESKAFHSWFGTDDELLAETNELIGEA